LLLICCRCSCERQQLQPLVTAPRRESRAVIRSLGPPGRSRTPAKRGGGVQQRFAEFAAEFAVVGRGSSLFFAAAIAERREFPRRTPGALLYFRCIYQRCQRRLRPVIECRGGSPVICPTPREETKVRPPAYPILGARFRCCYQCSGSIIVIDLRTAGAAVTGEGHRGQQARSAGPRCRGRIEWPYLPMSRSGPMIW